jgi:hypothetical protein
MRYTIIEEVINEYLDGMMREGFYLDDMPNLQEMIDSLMGAAQDPGMTYDEWVHELRYWRLTAFQDARGTEKGIIDNMLYEILQTVDVVERRGY